MNDPHPAPGLEGDGNAGVPGETEHVVTTMLRSDAVILMLARKTVEEGDASPAAHIAARRDLDREVREFLAWPSGEDYARAATDYERMGRTDDATLLRRMAATDTLIADAKVEWNTRYDARPPTLAGEMIGAMRQAGMIDFDPAGPYMGVDGAAYEPGALTIGGKPEPVLVITGRGTAEFITDWPGFDAMGDWIASRGSTASGPLTAPTAGTDCRAWEEDQVLARLVSSPREAPLLTAALTPDTFTTDVRYDVYQAIVTLADRGGYYTPEQLEAELRMRMAAVPTYALVNYGGATGLFARAYLARLASTEVSGVAAAATAPLLVQEDANHCKRLTQTAARAQVSTPAVEGDRLHGRTQAGGSPLLQPPPQPGPGAAVAQRP
jgi:hypothetical protein